MNTIRAGLISALVASACCGCASMAAPPAQDTIVALAPGGRAEGRLSVPVGVATAVRLDDLGPGRTDFFMRMENGVVLQRGLLDRSAQVRFTPVAPMTLVVVLECRRDPAALDAVGTRIACTVEGADGAALTWDQSR